MCHSRFPNSVAASEMSLQNRLWVVLAMGISQARSGFVVLAPVPPRTHRISRSSFGQEDNEPPASAEGLEYVAFNWVIYNLEPYARSGDPPVRPI